MKKGSMTRKFMVNAPSRTRFIFRSWDPPAGYVSAQKMEAIEIFEKLKAIPHVY